MKRKQLTQVPIQHFEPSSGKPLSTCSQGEKCRCVRVLDSGSTFLFDISTKDSFIQAIPTGGLSERVNMAHYLISDENDSFSERPFIPRGPLATQPNAFRYHQQQSSSPGSHRDAHRPGLAREITGPSKPGNQDPRLNYRREEESRRHEVQQVIDICG